jgi:hypothetical protein
MTQTPDMNKVRASLLLLAISLGLLVTYGIDVAIASSSAVESEESGFIPLNASARGSLFGGSAVIMSIIAFLISRNAFSITVPALLFVNGGLILAGMAILVAQGALTGNTGTTAAMRTISFTITTGGILVGLGVWKVITNAKIVEGKKTPS